MEAFGLRDRGAAFPRASGNRSRGPAPAADGDQIDEGTGDVKDRWYLERDPHRFIEARSSPPGRWASTNLRFNLRDDSMLPRHLEKEIAALQADPPCRLPPIHLRPGGRLYCGENRR